jgi:hypothetical protein
VDLYLDQQAIDTTTPMGKIKAGPGPSATERKVRKQLAKGVGILKVAKSLGIYS